MRSLSQSGTGFSNEREIPVKKERLSRMRDSLREQFGVGRFQSLLLTPSVKFISPFLVFADMISPKQLPLMSRLF